jgi:hypothetical protein
MKFSPLGLLSLAAVAVADFSIWDGSCNTGLGESGGFEVSAAQKEWSCDGGCSLAVTADGYEGGSPCNPDGCGETLQFVANGDNLDIILAVTQGNVGYCEPTTEPLEACNEALYSCSYIRSWNCISDFC